MFVDGSKLHNNTRTKIGESDNPVMTNNDTPYARLDINLRHVSTLDAVLSESETDCEQRRTPAKTRIHEVDDR